MRAVRFEDSGYEVAKLLIESGSDINVRSLNDGWTPLMSAIFAGSVKCAKLAISNTDISIIQNNIIYERGFFSKLFLC